MTTKQDAMEAAARAIAEAEYVAKWAEDAMRAHAELFQRQDARALAACPTNGDS